jgi:protein required for attachment to host cells
VSSVRGVFGKGASGRRDLKVGPACPLVTGDGNAMDQERIWYVVMNSNRARILRGLPEPHAPAASELSLQSRHLRLRDHLQDKPTRSFSSGSPGRRSAVEPSSDPLREDLLRFLHDVQDFLAGERQANAFDSLVVVAPAEVIGLWRQALHEPLASVIRAELRKNLIHLSAHDLIEVLRDTPKTVTPPG